MRSPFHVAAIAWAMCLAIGGVALRRGSFAVLLVALGVWAIAECVALIRMARVVAAASWAEGDRFEVRTPARFAALVWEATLSKLPVAGLVAALAFRLRPPEDRSCIVESVKESYRYRVSRGEAARPLGDYYLTCAVLTHVGLAWVVGFGLAW